MAQRKRKKVARKNPNAKKKTKKSKPKGPALQWDLSFWRKNWLPALLLFLLPFALYWRSTDYGYVLDDQIVITDNDYTKEGFNGLWKILTTESMQGYFGEQKNLVAGNRYRPLSIMTFAVEHEFSATEYTNNEGETMMTPSPWLTHFNNILFYALTILLIFRVVGGILPRKNRHWWLGLAFLSALIYALHPVHVEAVANVKGRDEILTMLLSLGTLYFALRYAAKPGAGWLAASGITFFLAILAKENAVTFLAVIPLTLYFFTRISRRHNLTMLGALFGIFVAYLIMRGSIVGSFFNPASDDLLNNPFVEMNVGQKLATIQYTLGDYIRLLFIPHPLTHDYYPYHIPIMEWTDWQVLLSLLLYAGMTIVALRQFRKKTILSWSILFYLLTLSIVSNIVFPVGVFMNERFLFMPSLGFCVLAGWFISRKLPEWVGQDANLLNIGLALLLVAGYGVRTWTRLPAWKDPLSLNRAAVQVSQNSARANCFMGTALYHEFRAKKQAGQIEEAKAILEEAHYHIKRSLEVYPTYYSALTMKSGIAAERYKFDKNLDQLLQEFYEIIVIKNRITFIDQFLEYLSGRADQQKLVDFIHRVAHDHFLLNARTNDSYGFAAHYLNLGLKVAPNNPRLLYDYYLVYQAAGNTAKAQEYLARARAADPGIGTRN